MLLQLGLICQKILFGFIRNANFWNSSWVVYCWT